MEELKISLSAQNRYKFYGLFEAPSKEWMHMSRTLEEFQLILMVKGTLYIADKKEKYMVSTGEYLIMKPGFQYGYKPSQCSFYWVHFDCPFMNVPKEQIISLPCRGNIKNLGRFHVLFTQLNDIYVTYENQFASNFFATNILLELFNQVSSKNPIPASAEDKLHRNIITYIKWSRAYRVKVKDLAEHFGYHPKYLSTVFRKKEGTSLKQYLIDQTMECAKEELCNTERSILSIALSMGFCDGQAFSHSFKHAVGVTPTEYRNSHQFLDKNDN